MVIDLFTDDVTKNYNFQGFFFKLKHNFISIYHTELSKSWKFCKNLPDIPGKIKLSYLCYNEMCQGKTLVPWHTFLCKKLGKLDCYISTSLKKIFTKLRNFTKFGMISSYYIVFVFCFFCSHIEIHLMI